MSAIILHRTREEHAPVLPPRRAARMFLREEVPKNWRIYCDSVTDNFRVISPKDFRVLT